MAEVVAEKCIFKNLKEELNCHIHRSFHILYAIHFNFEIKGLQLLLIVILSVNDMVRFQTQTPGAIQKET